MCSLVAADNSSYFFEFLGGSDWAYLIMCYELRLSSEGMGSDGSVLILFQWRSSQEEEG